MPGTLFEKTVNRLNGYKLFSSQITKRVGEFLDKQAQYETYQSFLKAVQVPLEPILFVNQRGRGVPLVDIAARVKKQAGVFVIHLPMANSLDTNQLYQIATTAWQFPEYRIIAFGNPSGKQFAYPQQNFSVVNWFRVAFTKNRRAVVGAELDYLASQNIQSAIHIGYSFGALKALLAAKYSSPETIQRLILIDPVAHSRYPKQLLEDFQRTFKPLGAYVDRTELPTFLAAREHAAQTVHYTKGLLRPVNTAIGLMLARVDFIPLLKEVLQRNANLKLFVAWGSKSELGNDAHMQANLHTLAANEAKGRLRFLRLAGETHAFGNDLALYTAIVHTALEPSE